MGLSESIILVGGNCTFWFEQWNEHFFFLGLLVLFAILGSKLTFESVVFLLFSDTFKILGRSNSSKINKVHSMA